MDGRRDGQADEAEQSRQRDDLTRLDDASVLVVAALLEAFAHEADRRGMVVRDHQDLHARVLGNHVEPNDVLLAPVHAQELRLLELAETGAGALAPEAALLDPAERS